MSLGMRFKAVGSICAPGENVGHDDVLHWTQPSHNWNFMCADCHSTAVAKGYDAEAHRYETRFAEVSVGCEACHGPGSAHAAPAGRKPQAGARLGARPAGRNQRLRAVPLAAAANSPTASNPQHSYFDHYSPALLDADLYHADGQVLDEVFVYGSFLQKPDV